MSMPTPGLPFVIVMDTTSTLFPIRNLVTNGVQGLLACAQHLVGFIASYGHVEDRFIARSFICYLRRE
jgi:hypothetical protein